MGNKHTDARKKKKRFYCDRCPQEKKGNLYVSEGSVKQHLRDYHKAEVPPIEPPPRIEPEEKVVACGDSTHVGLVSQMKKDMDLLMNLYSYVTPVSRKKIEKEGFVSGEDFDYLEQMYQRWQN